MGKHYRESAESLIRAFGYYYEWLKSLVTPRKKRAKMVDDGEELLKEIERRLKKLEKLERKAKKLERSPNG